MINVPITNISFLLALLTLFSHQKLSNANDTMNTTQSITGYQTLVSSGGSFELGFFSPGSSNNWYAGIWYKNITPKTVVWVANREIPLRNSTSGVLKINETGFLVILNETNNIIWSSKILGAPAQNPVTQILDSGNLIVRDENDDQPENYLWQSFDYPTDTFLMGVKLGWNYVTGIESYLSSWKNDEDPAPGDYTFRLDPAGYPQVFTRRGADIQYRIGPRKGEASSGTLIVRNEQTFQFGLQMNKNGVYYSWVGNKNSTISRFTLNPNGFLLRSAWVDETRVWVPYQTIPVDNCDTYRLCGANGNCDIGNNSVCGCLNKFVPKDPQGWSRADWSNGCVRRTELNCTAGDGFLMYSNIKLPDSRTSWYNASMELSECKDKCLKNCSCMAYTNSVIGRGSGCMLWFGDLVDIRVLSVDGQDLYIRMASSELENEADSKRKGKLIWSLTTVGTAVLALSVLLYIWKRVKNGRKGPEKGSHTETHDQDLELPMFDLSTISKATNNFSFENKLGEGGYGPVYKGTLEDGQDIAVKRLSKTSMQGLDEFKNEVICIAKLQHRNLVKLLGCCIQGSEKMLIYEYMPNKSLDLILFDQKERMYVDWPKRLHIVNGIARGLMYLHQDSRLRIIHRDLKASNVLLDNEMNPKISDFGLAKRFKGNETEDQTSRVVGTYGYMSPEYAVRGEFSIKSDVFSFGVLVLEIVSGKRNSSFSYGDHHLTLLGHAWSLYKQGRSIELVDAYLLDSASLDQVLRLIHVGLLCVQQHPDDRPNMNSVVAMLSNEVVLLPQANHPGFFTENDRFASVSNTFSYATSSTNEVAVTVPEEM